MTALSNFLNRLGTVETGILTVLFLALSYFFLRSGQHSSAPRAPVASSTPPETAPPSAAPEGMPVPAPSVPAMSSRASRLEPEPLRSLKTTPVGPATREFMELLARMSGESDDAQPLAGEEHWSSRSSQRG